MGKITLSSKGGYEVFSTDSNIVYVGLPYIVNWDLSPYSHVAQLFHVNKNMNGAYLKLPMTVSLSASVKNISASFTYYYHYKLVNSNRSYVSERVYNEDINATIRSKGISIPFSLMTHSTQSQNSYGLTRYDTPRIDRSFEVSSSMLGYNGSDGFRFSVLGITGSIPAGNYWVVLPCKHKLTEDSVLWSDLKRIADSVKDKILQKEAAYTASRTDISEYRVEFGKDYEDVILRALVRAGISVDINYHFFDGICPQGIGPHYYVSGGRQIYLTDRLDVEGYAGPVYPAFALKSGSSWIFPNTERYLIAALEEVGDNPDSRIEFSLSMSGLLNEDNLWTPWEYLFQESGSLAFFRVPIDITDPKIGGNHSSGNKTVYIRFRRKVKGSSNTLVTQYAIDQAHIYYSAPPPIIYMARLSYFRRA